MRFRTFLLAVFTAAFSCGRLGAAEPRLSVPDGNFPLSVAGATWLQLTNFAHDGSPGGVGVSYRSPKLKVDIYVFDAGDPALVAKSLDERFAAEIAGAPAVMKELERRGHYKNVQLSSAREAKAASGLAFSHLRITYEEKGEKKLSHYYLAKYRERLLKIRLTAAEPADDAMLQRAFAEASAPFTDRS